MYANNNELEVFHSVGKVFILALYELDEPMEWGGVGFVRKIKKKIKIKRLPHHSPVQQREDYSPLVQPLSPPRDAQYERAKVG